MNEKSSLNFLFAFIVFLCLRFNYLLLWCDLPRTSGNFFIFPHFFAVKWRIFCTSCLIVANFLNALTRHLASASVKVFILDGNSEHVAQVWRKRDFSEYKFSAAVDWNKCLKPIKLLILLNTFLEYHLILIPVCQSCVVKT